MRLLLDECVPARQAFDVFITVDKNLPYQQNAATLPVAIVVLNAASNELSQLLPLIPALEHALLSLVKGSCVLIPPGL